MGKYTTANELVNVGGNLFSFFLKSEVGLPDAEARQRAYWNCKH